MEATKTKTAKTNTRVSKSNTSVKKSRFAEFREKYPDGLITIIDMKAVLK
jgi:hypothetical protein